MPTIPARNLLVTLALAGAMASGAGAELTTARGADGWCGTSDLLLEQILERQRLHQRLDRASGPKKAGRLPTKVEVRKEGNVAVAIDNANRMIRERNLFDLDDEFAMQFRFRKKSGGYEVKSAGAFNGEIGDKLDLGDDDSVRIDLPFKVKMFGRRYGSLFINSDGNVTFDEPDFASTARDVSRFLEGPPRLAPFFADLNPETAPPDGGVYLLIGAKSLRITWLRVPEFDANGLATRQNTFQMILARNGKATYSYREMGSREGIVGLAPGGGSSLNLLDYSDELPAPVNEGAIAESFADSLSIDDTAIATVFLENFADRYMTLMVFTDFPFLLLGSPGTVAYEQTVKNEIRGIGEARFDVSRFFGSDGGLESFVMMGNIDKYGDDIEDQNQLGGVYSPLDIALHEFGHRWGVKTLYERDGEVSDGMLGRQKAHWSYCFNSKNSYLEGNRWQDNMDGTFSAVAGEASFNDFDLYNMGLLGAESVEGSFLITGNTCNGDQGPRFDGGATGEPVDIEIEDVIRALGEREPSFAEASQRFEVAFLLLVKGGEEPREGSIEQVNAFRQGLARRIAEQGGRVVTKLRFRK